MLESNYTVTEILEQTTFIGYVHLHVSSIGTKLIRDERAVL